MAKVSVKIDGDSKGAEQAIKKVKDQLGKIADNKALGGFNQIGLGFGSIKTMAGTAVEGIKKVVAAMNECAEAYRIQANAEIQLETAARNNPYLNSESVTNLKNFASSIQSMTTYGDEELLPFMAKLAAAGRTEAQIMDIMTAAADMAASGTMSLESAVNALNGTYQGNVGLLGKQISGVKSLTKEELANGDAVKLVAEKYKGMAEEVAKATGSTKQLKNAWGDFKEHLGSGFEAIIAPINRGITSILTNVNNAISRLKQARVEAKIDEQVIEGNLSKLDSAQAEQSSRRLSEKQSEAQGRMESLRSELWERYKNAGYSDKEIRQALQRILNPEYDGGDAVEVAYKDAVKVAAEATANYQAGLEALRKLSANETIAKHDAEKAEKKSILNSELTALQQEVQKARDSLNAKRAVAGLAVMSDSNMTAEEKNYMHEAIEKALVGAVESSVDSTELQKDAIYKNLLAEMKKYPVSITPVKSAGSSTKGAEPKDIIEEAVKAYAATQQELLGKQNMTGKFEAGSRETTEFLYDSLYKILEKIVKENPNAIQISESGNLQTATGDQRLVDLLEKFNDLASSMRGYENEDERNATLEEFFAMVEDAMTAEEIKPLSEQLEDRKKELEEFAGEVAAMYKEDSNERLGIDIATAAAITDLEKQITEAKKSESEERRRIAMEEAQTMLSYIKQYTDKSAELINYLADLNMQVADAEKAQKIADLEEQYEQGIITETEYAEKQKQIDKETAEAKYKAEMWQWTSNIAQMAVSGAQAVLAALSTQPIYAGIAMAGLVGAMTAAQMGVAIANKPKAPSFAQGGIVPGSSWSGDKVQANVNSGEMILTRSQQADLWKRLNSGQSGWGSVAVNNYLGNQANIRTKRDGNGLTVDVLDAHINHTMSHGGYDAGFAGREVASRGVRII